MKRIISFLLVVCIYLCVSVIFNGCVGKHEHTHTYKIEWSKNTICHWHECENNECTAVSDKANHSYGAWFTFDDSQHKKICECGSEITEIHNWNNGVITTQPSETSTGVKTFTCIVCGKTKTELVEFVSKWKSYFIFDNVSATYCGEGEVGETTIIENQSIKKQGEKWIWNRQSINNDVLLIEKTVYCDGENKYVNGDIDNTATEALYFFYYADFSLNESDFIKISDDVFFASSTVYHYFSDYTFTDVTIILEKDKIYSISAKLSSPYAETINITYYFYDWNTTIVE